VTRARVAILAIIVVPWFAATAFAGPFEDGVAAYDKGQLDAAFALWLPLAQQGHVAAQYNVANMYEKGTGVARDAAQAAHWYVEAAKGGDIDAEFKAAQLYETGTGIAPDADTARTWYEAVIANPRRDRTAALIKEQARDHIAKLTGATQEIVAYDTGRFVLVRAPDGPCVIAMQGAVTRDADDKFDDVVARSTRLGCDKPWVMLESPGGLVHDGLVLGRQIRVAGYRTITRYACDSACSLIFMGGVERVLAGSRAKIGLHQPAVYLNGGKEKRCLTSDDVSRDLRRYFAFVVPATADRIMDLMMSTSCMTIKLVGGNDALDLGIATALEGEHTDLFGTLASHAARAGPVGAAPVAATPPSAAPVPAAPASN
jgi:ATP-dependent protease ClpP protease subunit